MENPKTAAVERLKEANNVLVTVSTNPSVDQLAGAIGLTLLLNKLGKHATAVFSGDIPSTIEFLQPEQTLEKDTNSLRDFIISLDKAKADKLRYKVEEKLVRIFITPYHTSLSHDDLEFSLGDFNVDAIVALGVHEQQDLDQAIAAHGRILHDATIIAINTQPNGSLGTISWVDEKASSLSEMAADLGLALKSDVLDAQMATALLTGIVAETDRFSNQKTTSATMSLSAKLMAAGANQQLVATKLQESSDNMLPQTQPDNIPPATDNQDDEDDGDGSLRIDHNGSDGGGQGVAPIEPVPDQQEHKPSEEDEHPTVVPDTPKLMMEPPTMGSTLTAIGQLDDANNVNPLSLPPISTPLLSHDSDKKDADKKKEDKVPPEPEHTEEVEEPIKVEEPAPAVEQLPPEPPVEDSKTLEEIEEAVESPHIQPDTEQSAEPDLQAALQSFSNDDDKPAADGAQPVNLDLGHQEPPSAMVTPAVEPAQDAKDQYLDVAKLDEETGLPANVVPQNNGLPQDTDATNAPSLPPPPLVPPPIMPAPPPITFDRQALDNNHEENNQTDQPLAPL